MHLPVINIDIFIKQKQGWRLSPLNIRTELQVLSKLKKSVALGVVRRTLKEMRPGPQLDNLKLFSLALAKCSSDNCDSLAPYLF
jgi:hypothetical protein